MWGHRDIPQRQPLERLKMMEFFVQHSSCHFSSRKLISVNTANAFKTQDFRSINEHSTVGWFTPREAELTTSVAFELPFGPFNERLFALAVRLVDAPRRHLVLHLFSYLPPRRSLPLTLLASPSPDLLQKLGRASPTPRFDEQTTYIGSSLIDIIHQTRKAA
ncbi:hypothetical protein CC2G_005218 [Coprinopsis cinerea AmutBmut pab1-1]|nr:hypothetical protein CC2G_005218 [Coprinopsis cinerea AmutBmut pab1-1]